jgi:ABC-type enterochelin transport system permease subunit
MTPTVNAIITPSIITLDAFCVNRITAALIVIIAIAAINDAGAITHSVTRDCI